MNNKKQRKCLQEITNTKTKRDIEYGYVVDDSEILELDLVDSPSDEFYTDYTMQCVD